MKTGRALDHEGRVPILRRHRDLARMRTRPEAGPVVHPMVGHELALAISLLQVRSYLDPAHYAVDFIRTDEQLWRASNELVALRGVHLIGVQDEVVLGLRLRDHRIPQLSLKGSGQVGPELDEELFLREGVDRSADDVRC